MPAVSAVKPCVRGVTPGSLFCCTTRNKSFTQTDRFVESHGHLAPLTWVYLVYGPLASLEVRNG